MMCGVGNHTHDMYIVIIFKKVNEPEYLNVRAFDGKGNGFVADLFEPVVPEKVNVKRDVLAVTR